MSRRKLVDERYHAVALGKVDFPLLVEYHCPGFEGEFFHIKFSFFWFGCHWQFLPVFIFYRLWWIILKSPRLSRFQFYHKEKFPDWRLFDRKLTLKINDSVHENNFQPWRTVGVFNRREWGLILASIDFVATKSGCKRITMLPKALWNGSVFCIAGVHKYA